MISANVPTDHSLYDICKDIIIPLLGSILSFFAVLIAIKAVRDNTKIGRANYEYQITQADRDIWRHIASQKHLKRIKDTNADASEISEEEKVNTNFIVLNVKTLFEALDAGIISSNVRQKLLMKDVGEFFSLPIPNKVWQAVEEYHASNFRKFVNDSIYMHQNGGIPSKNHHWLLVKVIKIYSSTKSGFVSSFKGLRIVRKLKYVRYKRTKKKTAS